MKMLTKEYIEEIGKILLPEEPINPVEDIGTCTVDNNQLAWVSRPGESYLTMSEPTAVIEIGSWYINIYDKTFTEEQIKNMREFFGWEVRNLCE